MTAREIAAEIRARTGRPDTSEANRVLYAAICDACDDVKDIRRVPEHIRGISEAIIDAALKRLAQVQ